MIHFFKYVMCEPNKGDIIRTAILFRRPSNASGDFTAIYGNLDKD